MTLLLDCGPGIVAELAKSDRIAGLDGVIVSHRHADHCSDLITLAYHRSFPRRLPPIPLFGPSDLVTVLEQVDQTFGIPSLVELKAPIASALPFQPLRPGVEQDVLGVRVATFTMNHPVPTLAMRFPSIGLVYTADGSLSDDLIKFSSHAELLVAEATYLDSEGRDLVAHGHMTASGAGTLAHRADVQRLIVTHFASCADREAIRQRAEIAFGSPVIAAAPGLVAQLT